MAVQTTKTQKFQIVEDRIIKPAILQPVTSTKVEAIKAKEASTESEPVSNVSDDNLEIHAPTESAITNITEKPEDSAPPAQPADEQDAHNGSVSAVNEKAKESSRTLVTVTTIPASKDSGQYKCCFKTMPKSSYIGSHAQ